MPEFFGLGLLAVGHSQDQVVDFLSHFVKRGMAFENAAGIDIHVV